MFSQPQLAMAFTIVRLALSPAAAHAEDLRDILKKVGDYAEEQNYTKAMEELSWAKKELEKKNVAKLETLFPEEIMGFKGADFASSGALGLTSLKRTYRKGNQKVDVSLAGGSDDSMGALAGMARMGIMMGANSPGREAVRIDGRAGLLDTKSKNPSLTLTLDSGQILEFKGNVTPEELKSFASELKLTELEAYLKGSK